MADDRDFFEQLLNRHVEITEAQIATMNAGFAQVSETMNAGFAQVSETMNAGFGQLQAEIADMREQIQANTQALLRVLDRLD